jgi:hypothetical protein
MFQKKLKATKYTDMSTIYDYIHDNPNCKFKVKIVVPKKDGLKYKTYKCRFLSNGRSYSDVYRQMEENENDEEFRDMKYLYKVRFGTGKKYWDKTMYWNDFCSMVVKGFIKFC